MVSRIVSALFGGRQRHHLPMVAMRVFGCGLLLYFRRLVKNHRKPDGFAFLSDDIIYDVLQFAHYERLAWRFRYETLRLGGRWGEIAAKFIVIEFKDGKLQESGRLINAEEQKSVFVNKLHLSDKADFGEIMNLAPNAYESLAISTWRSIPVEFTKTLGSRFTSVNWSSMQRAPLLDTELDFIKRQLRSPHLRRFQITAAANCARLTEADFTELLLDLVRRNGFEKLLILQYGVSSPASFSWRLFFTAYEVWLQRNNRRSWSVEAAILGEDRHELITRIPNFSWRYDLGSGMNRAYRKRHPTDKRSEMTMNLCVFEAGHLTMDFYSYRS